MSELQKINVISPNMIKIFCECPMKFYYKYVEHISIPSFDVNFKTGQNIHALASYYLNGNNIEKFERTLSEKENLYWTNLKNNKLFQKEVYGIEKNVSRKLSDFWIGGRIDAIVKEGSDFYILDYKTGGVSDDMTYDPQTMVYLIACDGLINEYNSLTFVYIDLKNDKEVKIALTESLKKEYLQKLEKICFEILSYNPKKDNITKKCTCEYSKICLKSC